MISSQEIEQVVRYTECFEPSHGLFGCISFRSGVGTVFISRSSVGVLASYRQQQGMPIPGAQNYPCKVVWNDDKIGCRNFDSGEKGCGLIDPDFEVRGVDRYGIYVTELKFDVMSIFGCTFWEQYQEVVRRERKNIFRRVTNNLKTNVSEFIRLSFESFEGVGGPIPGWSSVDKEKIYLKEFVEKSYGVTSSGPNNSKVQGIPVVGVKSKRKIIFKD